MKSKIKAELLPPFENILGNLLWNPLQVTDKNDLIIKSVAAFTSLGYWASPFPEGDGVTFKCENNKKDVDQIHQDLNLAFPWLEINISPNSRTALLKLADLAGKNIVLCKVLVPLSQILIQESFSIVNYRFICRREFDEYPDNEVRRIDSEYLEFDIELEYHEFITINSTHEHNNKIINKCLSLAENAMDIIRYEFSSFSRPQFTPNPAGQMADGFYSVIIIPEDSNLKEMTLSGISRPMSMSNNWLGPEVEEQIWHGYGILHEILAGRSDELGINIKTALRSSRQSFYSLGDESKFLNLIFALDGLVSPDKKWVGWKHRTYLAALISHGDISTFPEILRRYDELYVEIRNKLVHGGKDFFELSYDPNKSCDEIYENIKSVIHLIDQQKLSSISELHKFAYNILTRPDISLSYKKTIQEISIQRGTLPTSISW